VRYAYWLDRELYSVIMRLNLVFAVVILCMVTVKTDSNGVDVCCDLQSRLQLAVRDSDGWLLAQYGTGTESLSVSPY